MNFKGSMCHDLEVTFLIPMRGLGQPLKTMEQVTVDSWALPSGKSGIPGPPPQRAES